MAQAGNLYYVTRTDPSTGAQSPASGKRRIFISYRKSDNRLTGARDRMAEKILSVADVAVWYDRNLTAGMDYNKEITDAIAACDAVVLLLTKDILKSDYVWSTEITEAKNQKKAIIPIAYDISKKDYKEVERRLDGTVQILCWHDGEDDGADGGEGSFDTSFRQALDKFVINTDLAMRTEQFFASKTHMTDTSDLTGEQLFLMGFGYLRGVGTEPDESKGTEILKAVINTYGENDGVKKLRSKAAAELAKYYWAQRKPKEVLEYNKTAAETGSAEAMCFLGDMFYYGRGVPRDREEAVGWYKKAACTADSTEAMLDLGKIYYYGRGAERDLKKAEEWYSKAADKGDPAAMFNLAEMRRKGESESGNDTAASELYIRAAKAGSTSAMAELGRMFRSGDGVERDKGQAFYWYSKAVENGGYKTAFYKLGDMYANGEGTDKDIEKARELYSTAAEMGSVRAKKRLEALPAPKHEAVGSAVAEQPAAETVQEKPAAKHFPIRRLVPAVIILLIAAVLCGLQISGAFDIIGWLGSLLRA